ncbi:MAG: ABC transporter ATP-binding protein [bacterium]
MLKIENLRCGYDSRFILQDINFGIERGDFLGIIGPNGSGKTTILRAILRLLRPQKGSIFFEGQDIWKIKIKDLAQKIAIVSQSLPQDSMKVEEFVLLGRIPHFKGIQFLETRKDIEITKRSLELTQTTRFKDQPLNEISGGERQLVLIARALAQEPRLLLLDEPTSHLDITHQVKILDMIRRLNKEVDLTVLMVLHDLNLASEYCSRLVLINNGRIYKIGNPEEVLDCQIIEEVYKTRVLVERNPLSVKPYVIVISEEQRQKEGVTKDIKILRKNMYTTPS